MGFGIALLLTGCRRPSHHQGIYDRASVKIEAGQMVKLTHPAGVAVVDFTSFRPDGASYRWRFLSNSNNVESSGSGEVKDTSKKLLPILSYQSRSDTNFYVRAGGLWIPWSYGSANSAWLYYTKGRTEVVVLPDSGFETEELSNPAQATGNPVPDERRSVNKEGMR
jgi:hypothetical protein